MQQELTMTATDKVNILMVDDQPAKLLSYEAILGELGENLIKAGSGREALEVLLKSDVAVVLMDVSMPEMDGFEMAEIIRQHPRFQKTAIIFISAVHLTDLDRLKGYERGAVDYISVPVVPEVLRAKVSIFAELHRKTRQLEALNFDLEKRVLERTEELRESEIQFRTLANSIPQLAWMADPDGSVFWYNQRWYDYTGTTLSEVQQHGWQKVHHPDHVARVTAGIRRSWRTGEEWEDTCPLRGSDGQYRWFLSRAVPIRDSHGKVVRWFGTSTDISRQIAAEDMLRERAELLELASEAIIVRDLNGVLKFWNSGAEALYGWKREEVIGKNVHELLQTSYPKPASAIMDAITSAGRWDGNLVQYTRDGREIIVASRQALKRDAEGQNAALLEINRDITAQLYAEEALRKTERMAAMGRVAGIIAHEINNPLEAITNAFYLLREHPSLDGEARYLAGMAEEELLRVSHITRQTLSFYRESQQAVMVSVAKVLDDVLELQSRSLRLSGIVLDKKYLTEGSIIGFPSELKQVFLNLVGNAIQAMPAGGRLRVRVADCFNGNGRERGVRVSVCDTGSGVKPEDAKRLFEPFFTTKSTKGTGLGLWISKGIVQKYDGAIQFRSLRLNGRNATCFSVFLPGARTAQRTESLEVKEPIGSA
jgi:PAS domain S-box-containing protein